MKKLLTLALAASMTLALSVNTFALGNYVLATDELGTEDETPADEDTEEETLEEPEEETPAPEEETPAPDEETPVPDESDKVNPDTGAEDFVGVAAAAAVFAGVGFVALKRK